MRLQALRRSRIPPGSRAVRILLGICLALALSGCPSARRPAPSEEPPVAAPGVEVPVRLFPGATPHRVIGKESLVRILVYRGGRLSGAGHNHVIASRDVHGIVYLHEDPTRSGFDLVVPVGLLEVDDPELRREEGPDFTREVPEAAQQGTRKNMLGASLLDAERFPGIALSSVSITGTPESLQALTRVTVKDHTSEILIPITAEYAGDRVTGTGEFDLKQSDLGLEPFSVLMGALRVQDRMRVKFHLVAEKE